MGYLLAGFAPPTADDTLYSIFRSRFGKTCPIYVCRTLLRSSKIFSTRSSGRNQTYMLDWRHVPKPRKIKAHPVPGFLEIPIYRVNSFPFLSIFDHDCDHQSERNSHSFVERTFIRRRMNERFKVKVMIISIVGISNSKCFFNLKKIFVTNSQVQGSYSIIGTLMIRYFLLRFCSTLIRYKGLRRICFGI